jgi:hypothetical protein
VPKIAVDEYRQSVSSETNVWPAEDVAVIFSKPQTTLLQGVCQAILGLGFSDPDSAHDS